MDFKVVIGDPETGKSYQQEMKEDKTKKVKGKKIGDEIDGAVLGLTGYKLVITGGSDKGGFPIKKGVHGRGGVKVLMKGGVGYNKRCEIRKRKRVKGEVISEDIVQVNMKITTRGKKTVEELLGLGEKEEEKNE
ncbi:MAG: 30S ribosomal protein S6e [Candidatus Altiarchaeota archaeon]|nr:30S ribosomal protein S6e [Candidatus Altiarchaeota archaeon]